jgi:hypothetical protein
MAQGVPEDWATGPAPAAAPKPQDPVARLAQRRDNARWTAAVGFLLLFAARFSADFVIGGMLMVAYGVLASFYWSRRIRKVKGDPWDYDPDLDGPHDPEWKGR